MANRQQLYRYKGNRCAYCGLSVQDMMQRYGTFNRMFQLNHVDPKKKHGRHGKYENVIRRQISTEQLDEVDKCVLLCNECHGIVHAQNIYAEVYIRITFAGRTVHQRMKGQIIKDDVLRRLTFLCNERLLLRPYQVHLGDGPPQLLFGTELSTGGLMNLVNNIADHKRIIITNLADIIQFQMDYLGGDDLKCEQNISFPIFSYELAKDRGDPLFMWIRNGFALTNQGEVLTQGTLTYEGTVSEWHTDSDAA